MGGLFRRRIWIRTACVEQSVWRRGLYLDAPRRVFCFEDAERRGTLASSVVFATRFVSSDASASSILFATRSVAGYSCVSSSVCDAVCNLRASASSILFARGASRHSASSSLFRDAVCYLGALRVEYSVSRRGASRHSASRQVFLATRVCILDAPQSSILFRDAEASRYSASAVWLANAVCILDAPRSSILFPRRGASRYSRRLSSLLATRVCISTLRVEYSVSRRGAFAVLCSSSLFGTRLLISDGSRRVPCFATRSVAEQKKILGWCSGLDPARMRLRSSRHLVPARFHCPRARPYRHHAHAFHIPAAGKRMARSNTPTRRLRQWLPRSWSPGIAVRKQIRAGSTHVRDEISFENDVRLPAKLRDELRRVRLTFSNAIETHVSTSQRRTDKILVRFGLTGGESNACCYETGDRRASAQQARSGARWMRVLRTADSTAYDRT